MNVLIANHIDGYMARNPMVTVLDVKVYDADKFKWKFSLYDPSAIEFVLRSGERRELTITNDIVLLFNVVGSNMKELPCPITWKNIGRQPEVHVVKDDSGQLKTEFRMR